MGVLTIDNTMQDQAEAWVVRLSSDQVGEQDVQQFALWLAEDEQHRHCFDQVIADWQKLSVVGELPFDVDAILSARCDTADELAAPDNSANVVTPFKRRRQWSIAAVAASLLLAAVLVQQWLLPQWNAQRASQYYQSAIGEPRRLELSDGSVVSLNTNTRLTVAYSKRQRSITLSRGEAFFDVAKDSERPFTVLGCGTEARAVGTAFNVRCELQQGAVTVTEGIVQVTDLRGDAVRQGAGEQQRVLTSGQQLQLTERGDLALPVTVKDDSATSWRNGELVFNGATLREVVNEVSRYTPRKILIASPLLAATEVTGRFEIQDAEALLTALQSSLQMVVESRPDGSLLLKRALL